MRRLGFAFLLLIAGAAGFGLGVFASDQNWESCPNVDETDAAGA